MTFANLTHANLTAGTRRSLCAALMSAAALLAAQPAAAQAQCSQAHMAGAWTGALAYDYICTLNVTDAGIVRGTCQEDAGDLYRVRGRFTLNEDCVLNAELSLPGSGRYTGSGRVWGTASTRPDVGMVVSDRARLFWVLDLIRRP